MTATATAPSGNDKALFAGCFLALIATAFGFIVRAMLIDTWGEEFQLTDTQKGEIFGVGLWPFAISIVLFSLVIDKIGYGKAMVFAFVCHIASAIMTITAKSYDDLWLATFIVALGNGTVEAVINPVVATMFRDQKTKWLNILHAGWPGGLVLGGLIALLMGDVGWEYKVGLLLLPAVGYGLILMRCSFPVQERVEAGVSYRDMLREVGALGMFIVLSLVFLELARVYGIAQPYALGAAVAASVGFGLYVGAAGNPLFIVLLLIMIPLATTELGIDSWSASLMEGQMDDWGLSPVLVLVYTSAIMMVLRLFAGPIVHKLSPIGLLMASSALAAVGLYTLSFAEGAMILLAATLYGVGKTFFWPTMLGIVSERCPKGGALTLNATGGVGMLGVGVVGAVFLGYFQDTETITQLAEKNADLHAKVVAQKEWVLGEYEAVNPDMLVVPDDGSTPPLTDAERAEIDTISAGAPQAALTTAVIFPIIMLIAYVLLALYFKSKGGYKAEVLVGHDAEDAKFTGGTAGPGEA